MLSATCQSSEAGEGAKHISIQTREFHVQSPGGDDPSNWLTATLPEDMRPARYATDAARMPDQRQTGTT